MGLTESNLYSTFKNLDKDHSGTLSLSELISDEDPNTPIPYMCSLLAMYHFDTNKKGAINYSEFKRMYAHIQKILHQSTKKNLNNHVQGALNQFSKKIKVDYSHVDYTKKSNVDYSQVDDTQKIKVDFTQSEDTSMQFKGKSKRLEESASERRTIPMANSYQMSTPNQEQTPQQNTLPSNDVSVDTQATENGQRLSVSNQPSMQNAQYIPTAQNISTSQYMPNTQNFQNTDKIENERKSKQSNSLITIKTQNDSSSKAETSPLPQRDIQMSIHRLFNWKNLYNVQERNNFLNWLYKVCDKDKTNKVDLQGLEMFMKVVSKDGIDISALIFPENDSEIPSKLPFKEVIKRIMKQFDIGRDGWLTKQEFFTLGRLLLSCYQSIERLTEYSNMVVDSWTLKYTLGKGAYGIVKLAIKDGEQCAVKVVKLGNVSDMSKLDCEIQCLELLKHPNIVQLYNVINDNERIYIFMEICGGGTLYQLLEEKPFSESLARFYFQQLVDGIAYCQDKGVCHRDLRLENLLLSNSGDLKISDFGAARIFRKGWDLFSTQMAGSIYHLSPEQIEGNVYSGAKVDVWSCGVILFSFLTGELPFVSDNITDLFQQIQSLTYDYPEGNTISEEAKDLISRMLTVNPNDRISVDEIARHPWMKGDRKKLNLTKFVMKFKSGDFEAFCTRYAEELLNRDTFMLKEKISDTHYIARCVQASKYILFKSTIEKKSDSSIIVTSNLTRGAATHYLKVMKHVHRELVRKG